MPCRKELENVLPLFYEMWDPSYKLLKKNRNKLLICEKI